MERLTKILIGALFGLVALPTFAWKPWPLPMDSADLRRDTLLYGGEMQTVAASGTYAPFWFTSDRFGSVSEQPFSGNLSLYFGKELTRPNRWFDYSFGIEGVGRVDTKKVSAFLQRFYGHVRLYIVDITLGIKPQQYGNQDEELSSGGLLFSMNSRPMPRITIGIDQYTPFPLTYGYLEVKGGLTHGWFIDNVYVKHSYLHHKFVAGRLGGKLPVNISYEFHHAAQWGGKSPVHGDLGNSFRNFWNVFWARSGGSTINEQINAYGNHIGSQNLGIDVKWKNWKVSAYWQSIFEDGPVNIMWKAMNISDGLWGVSVKQTRWPFISSLCYEFINTTDQSGSFHDKDGLVFGGDDNYFNNSVYRNGWNSFYRTIGTPFITSPIYNADGSIATLNNRTMAHHIGLKGNIYGYRYRTLVTYAENYGLYNDGDALKSTNTAILLEVKKQFPKAWNLDFSLAFGADIGSQFGNSYSVMFSVTKRGIIKIKTKNEKLESKIKTKHNK
ncbi:MAG: capsule assembly Wzi family protein [Paludibacteraceae bacterium]